MTKEIDRLEREIVGLYTRLEAAHAERDALRAEVKRLTVAEADAMAVVLCLEGAVERLTAERDALKVAVVDLLRQAAEDNAVCLCGCAWDEHETVDEDSYSCEHDDHQCIQTCEAIAGMYQAALARVAELGARLELKDSGLLVRAVETAHTRAEKAEARIEAALSAHREGCLCSSCCILRSDPQPDETPGPLDAEIATRECLEIRLRARIERQQSRLTQAGEEIEQLRKGLEQMDWVYDAAGCTTGDCPHNDIHDCARALAQRLKEAQDEARALLDSGKGG